MRELSEKHKEYHRLGKRKQVFNVKGPIPCETEVPCSFFSVRDEKKEQGTSVSQDKGPTSHLTSPLWLFNRLERSVSRTEGTEFTRQKGTNTAASSVQDAKKDFDAFIRPSCFIRRA